MIETKIQIGEIENLLKAGKKILVKTINNKFAPITDFINKGLLKTYEVLLENGSKIKVTDSHKFFTDVGWLETKNIIPLKHSILCEDMNFSIVKSINNIGICDIVDITVDHPDQCYFGNGMLNHNSGKSLLGAYALSNTQKMGGIAVYIDTESAVTRDYLSAIGVDITKLMYLQMEALEDIFASIETIIEKVRASDKKRLVTILVDSVMGATTHKELEAEYGKDGYATDKAIILSKAMRKITGMISKENICLIFTNQLRVKMNAMFGDPYTTSGGKALAFHSSVRLRLTSLGQIKIKTKTVDEIVGIKTRAKIVKNRLGPPLKSVDYDIYFNSGIDDWGSWMTILKDRGIITGTAAGYTLKLTEKMEIIYPSSGEVVPGAEAVKFKAKEFGSVMDNNPKLKEYVYGLMSDLLVMKYTVNEDFAIDDITVSDEFVSEES